ncbi:MAG: hypothetical protein WC627_08305, partial [Legionella sp.]
MYNDQIILKPELEQQLITKFGEDLNRSIVLLIENLLGKDTYINNNLLLNLQNILALNTNQADFFIKLAHELAQTSAFAPVLLLEKIPTLIFYGINEEVSTFLRNIKDYGARAVALFLGSDLLKTEDLIDILEQTTLPFYKALLSQVNTRHKEFDVSCAIIMRCAAKIESIISENEIANYLDICSFILKTYGIRCTEQYLRNADDFNKFVPYADILKTLEQLALKSLIELEFAVTYPAIYFASSHQAPTEINQSFLTDTDSKAIKLKILKNEDYASFLVNSCIFSDKDFASLMLSWPILNKPIKANILFQLEQEDYKHYILNTDKIEHERRLVYQASNERWLDSWLFCEETIDINFIRKRLGKLLQNPKLFTIEAKSIVKNHHRIFDRKNTEYTNERVALMVDAVLQNCSDAKAQNELQAMKDFLLGNPNNLRNFLSETGFVIQVWERNPWRDYGRSDELFSCTSLGDYNAGNAPGFLADLNLNNL